MRKLCLTVCIAACLAGCSQNVQAPQNIAANGQEAATEPVEFETYSATEFFQTVSYGLSNSAGYSWSHDDKALLAHSDANGVSKIHSACRWRGN